MGPLLNEGYDSPSISFVNIYHISSFPNISVMAAGIYVHREVTSKVFNILQLLQFNLRAGNSHFVCQCFRGQLPAPDTTLVECRSSAGIIGIE